MPHRYLYCYENEPVLLAPAAAALSLPWIAACPREPTARLWLPVLFSPLCSCVIRLGGSFAYRGFYKKTYISYDEYPFSFYPPYCSGMGYILDGNLALRVYEMMNHIRPIKFEDVYVGICLNILKVNIIIPEEERNVRPPELLQPPERYL
ncbi:Hexosyltransferase [Aix galericulata]|nr:Hexosyltransferase [Aix galericulata]